MLLNAIAPLLIIQSDKGLAVTKVHQTMCNGTICDGCSTLIMMILCISTCNYSYVYGYDYDRRCCISLLTMTFM